MKLSPVQKDILNKMAEGLPFVKVFGIRSNWFELNGNTIRDSAPKGLISKLLIEFDCVKSQGWGRLVKHQYKLTELGHSVLSKMNEKV